MKRVVSRSLIAIIGLVSVVLIAVSWSSLVYVESSRSGVERHVVYTGRNSGQHDPDGVTHARPLLQKRASWLPGAPFRTRNKLCYECANDLHDQHRALVWIDTPEEPVTFECRCENPICNP